MQNLRTRRCGLAPTFQLQHSAIMPIQPSAAFFFQTRTNHAIFWANLGVFAVGTLICRRRVERNKIALYLTGAYFVAILRCLHDADTDATRLYLSNRCESLRGISFHQAFPACDSFPCGQIIALGSAKSLDVWLYKKLQRAYFSLWR
mgnify:CR=1 FL=1